ncbi:hypothetical protein ACTTAI_00715 (plasmid) [Rhodobacter capsulatus]|uniref:hypothetical protein n=1 Tax=Rhodobacter capsulatus TaxID=1061 RepID=UPI0040256FDF
MVQTFLITHDWSSMDFSRIWQVRRRKPLRTVPETLTMRAEADDAERVVPRAEFGNEGFGQGQRHAGWMPSSGALSFADLRPAGVFPVAAEIIPQPLRDTPDQEGTGIARLCPGLDARRLRCGE